MSYWKLAWKPTLIAVLMATPPGIGAPPASAPAEARETVAAARVSDSEVIPRRASSSDGSGIVRRSSPVRASDWLSWLVTLPLCLILLAIGLRGRWRGGLRGKASPSSIAVLSRTALGGRHSLVTARFGRRVLLLGISSDRVSLIAQTDDPVEVATLLGSAAAGQLGSATNEFSRMVEDASEEYQRMDGGPGGMAAGVESSSAPSVAVAGGTVEPGQRGTRRAGRQRQARATVVDGDDAQGAAPAGDLSDVTRRQMHQLSEHMRQFASGTAA